MTDNPTDNEATNEGWQAFTWAVGIPLALIALLVLVVPSRAPHTPTRPTRATTPPLTTTTTTPPPVRAMLVSLDSAKIRP